MSTTACPSNTTSTTSPSAAFPPDLVSLFKNHQQSATTEQPQPSPDNDDDDDNEDAGSWDGGCQKEEDGDDTNEAGHTKTTSIPAANNDYLKEDCGWVNFGKCSNTKISDINPALPTPHAGLFETIAKLAGIDTGQQAVQHEIGEENGADETPAIDQTLLDSILNPAKQPGSTTCSSTSSSSSSSRRKNGNPTRISDENGTKIVVEEEGKEDGAEVYGVGENGTEMEEEAGITDAEGTVAEESEETENGHEEGPKAKRRSPTINGIANHSSSNGTNGTLQPPPPSFGPAFPFSFAQQPQGLLEEQQRRVFAAAQQLAAAQQNQQHQQPQQMFNRLAQQLKEEFAGMLAAGTGDKDPQKQQQLPTPMDSFSAQEAQAQLGRLLASFSMAARQHQWMAELGGFLASAGSAMGSQPPQQPNPRSPFPSRAPAASHFVPPAAAAALANPFHALLAQNPLMAAAMMAASAGHQQQQQHQQHFQPTTATTSGQQQPAFGANGGGSIFPGGQPNGFMATPRPFAPLPPAQQQQHQSHHQQQRREFAFRSAADTDGSPRKKRAKVTDSVRGPRSSLHNLREPNACGGNYSSTSERSTPQGCFPAPPTMVPLGSLHHPHPHQQLLFRSPERNGHGASPAGGNNNNNDDDGSDRNSLGGDVQQQQMHSAQLTHVHLRKAKLMFFYQRYPSSAVLKSYFPDVQFNKHNTAQLVKWFSNFREFWYMCMEKFAKQAMAEGFTQREELLITTDSELFKQLNQHYNKNGVFQPPEKLQFVVQETLREFFTALQHQKDTEPSWKKAIYKVIQQLDEPIPEYFRDPQFVEMLEKTT